MKNIILGLGILLASTMVFAEGDHHNTITQGKVIQVITIKA